MIDFLMPSLGADMETGTLREWRKKVGDVVKRGDIIADVETQKGLIEIEVFDEGTVHELLLKEDDKVPVGTVMARILAPGEQAPPPGVRPVMPAVGAMHGIKASPLAKRFAAEMGIDLASVTGTGPEGAITKEDVEHALVARAAPGSPKPASAKVPPAAPAEGMRQAVAAAMGRSAREIPHYYLGTTIDMSHALAMLRRLNEERPMKERLLPAVLFIQAVAHALRAVPELNAYWENGPIRRKAIHVGFVVALRTGGIVVPAIHDADTKSLDELMKVLADLILRARSGRLRSSEVSDGTFTITSLGDQGVGSVHGVIYPPQVGLVGFGAIEDRPWAVDGKVEVRPVVTVTLAADHRATDGGMGSRFLHVLNDHLQHPGTP
jgi:pyruvate dehydrogenase E2 component (dihydrolipoamide acetyltransferase)